MLIWVNRKKVRKEIKKAWTAFTNYEYNRLSKHDDVQKCLSNWEAFVKSMASIAWMFGIHDSTPPSEWDDC